MIYLDIETDTKHKQIWLCVTEKDGEIKHWRNKDGLQEYLEGHPICGHNIIGFDAPVLKRVWDVTIPSSSLIDTLILSRLHNPDVDIAFIEGQKVPPPHSLQAWGIRLKCHKIDFTDYDAGWSMAMASYCEQDVLLLKKLHQHLITLLEKDKFSTQSIELEHKVAIICKQMEDNGFKLDMPKALCLLSELKTKLDIIQVEMETLFPPVVISGRTHGSSGKPLNDIVTPFNPGSRQQIAKRLQEKGWKPKKHTEKGSVIVDEEVLASLDYPEAKALAEYMMLQKRIAQITSWLDAVGSDGRVHGRVITNGAVTGRMTHMSPNMAQVPNSGSPYGHECRDLWTVEKGYKLVGIDASGLELRMLAHYMNDNEYTNEVVSGDIHTANQTAAGLQTRNQAKTFIYAFLYGAGSAKIGSIVGGSAKEGQKLIDSFLQNTPKLKRLREKVARLYAKEGWLQGLDGRKLLVRAEHSALNTLLQGAGAIVMKQAVVILHKRLRKAKIDFKMVANVHDEWQIEVEEQRAEEAGILGKEAIKEAGIILNMRCPLDGEYKIGNSWKETH